MLGWDETKFVWQENNPFFLILPPFLSLCFILFSPPPSFLSLLCIYSIVSFGAPVSNEYRLVVEGQLPISVQTSQVILVHNYYHVVSINLWSVSCCVDQLVISIVLCWSTCADVIYLLWRNCLEQDHTWQTRPVLVIDLSDKTTCNLKQPESVTPQFALIYTNGVGVTSILLKVQVSDYTQFFIWVYRYYNLVMTTASEVWGFRRTTCGHRQQ